ncbi:uncharacterized protein DS421_17g583830 [Arachis hypogaea]|nr:uncharacterized protein DS421_17g583830 [Arachis hypogaea]
MEPWPDKTGVDHHLKHGRREMDHINSGNSEMAMSPAAPTNWSMAFLAHVKWPTSFAAPTKYANQWRQQRNDTSFRETGRDQVLHALKIQKCNIGDGGSINVEEKLNRLYEVHIAAHLIHKPACVLTPHGTLVDVFMSEPADPSMDVRRQRLEPYL